MAGQKKAAVILNPSAGRGAGGKLLHRIEAALEQECPGDWTILTPTSAQDTTRIAKTLAEEGWERIGAAGGDGTLNLAAQGLVGTAAALAPIPAGTGNDFARSIGVSKTPEEAVSSLVNGDIQEADLLRVRDLISINSLACGFDAIVGMEVNEGGKSKGTLAYLGAVLKVLPSFRPFLLEIETSESQWTGMAMLCTVANACYYGGGMKIAPTASPFSGHMEIVIVGEMGRFELVQKLGKVFSGAHVRDEKVKVMQASWAKITTDPQMPVLADGDPAGYTPFKVELDPGAIRVVRPTGH
jgi:YegS/Rv2252/BmrU family lipid kinase